MAFLLKEAEIKTEKLQKTHEEIKNAIANKIGVNSPLALPLPTRQPLQDARIEQAIDFARRSPLNSIPANTIPIGAPPLSPSLITNYNRIIFPEKNGTARWPTFQEVAKAFDGFNLKQLQVESKEHGDLTCEEWYNKGLEEMLTTYYPYAAPTNAISDSYEGVPKVYAGFLSNEAATKPMRNEARCDRAA